MPIDSKVGVVGEFMRIAYNLSALTVHVCVYCESMCAGSIVGERVGVMCLNQCDSTCMQMHLKIFISLRVCVCVCSCRTKICCRWEKALAGFSDLSGFC